MEKVDLVLQNQWEAKPDEELKIPEAYIKNLNYEMVVFGKREFTFRCRSYEQTKEKTWVFEGVIIDTSRHDAQGNVTLKRFTYHPAISLIDVGFMVIPAPEGVEEN